MSDEDMQSLLPRGDCGDIWHIVPDATKARCPNCGTAFRYAPKDARELYRRALKHDVERQRAEEQAEQLGSLPPAGSQDNEPEDDKPIFPGITELPKQGNHNITGFNPGHPDWARHRLGDPPMVEPAPIQDPALTEQHEGGSSMTGGNPIEVAKAQLARVVGGLVASQRQGFANIESSRGKAMVIRGADSSLREQVTRINIMISKLEEQKTLAITSTAGHVTATPTRAIHQIDMAIQKLEEAVGLMRASLVDLDNAQIRVKNATTAVEEATTMIGGGIAEFNVYRTSF